MNITQLTSRLTLLETYSKQDVFELHDLYRPCLDRIWHQQMDFNTEWTASRCFAIHNTDLHKSGWSFDMDNDQVPLVQEISSQKEEEQTIQALLLPAETSITSKQRG